MESKWEQNRYKMRSESGGIELYSGRFRPRISPSFEESNLRYFDNFQPFGVIYG